MTITINIFFYRSAKAEESADFFFEDFVSYAEWSGSAESVFCEYAVSAVLRIFG